MQHVVLVAPYFSENMRHCVRCFAQLPDVTLGVLAQEHPDRVPEDLRALMPHYRQIGDPAHAANIVDGARALQQEWGRLDRIEGYLEMLQVPIAEARDALDVDGMRAEAAANCRDKNRMKDVLRKAGVPVARQALVRGIDDVRAFVAEVGYPIVMKPLAGFGSRDTQRVHDDASLAVAMNLLLPSDAHPVQAEEFVTGDEHTFEAVTLGGRTVWASSTAYLPRPLHVLENAWIQYAVVMSRELLPPHAQAFAETNSKALAALGVRDALSHMEWFLREDGTAVVSEVGARPPGANIMPLLAAAHGTDPWARWAELMVHRRWNMPERRFSAGTVFLRAMGGGEVVRAVEGADELRARIGPMLHDVRLPRPGQPRSRHYEGDGWVIVRHPDDAQVMAALGEVMRTLRVT